MRDYYGERDPRNMPTSMFGRAHYLDYSTAIKADITRQNYSVRPRYWYMDADYECERCGKNYGFTADEQRFWYEELQFFVSSTPRECRACRKEIREIKQLKQEYDREISTALRTDAPIELKRRLVQVIETLQTCGFDLPERVTDSFRVLKSQLDKANVGQ